MVWQMRQFGPLLTNKHTEGDCIYFVAEFNKLKLPLGENNASLL